MDNMNLQTSNPKAFWDIYCDLCDKDNVKHNNPIIIISPRLMNRNLPHSDLDFKNCIDNFVR